MGWLIANDIFTCKDVGLVAAKEEQRDNPLYTLVAFMSSDLQADLQGLVPAGGGSGQTDGDPSADSSAPLSPES